LFKKEDSQPCKPADTLCRDGLQTGQGESNALPREPSLDVRFFLGEKQNVSFWFLIGNSRQDFFLIGRHRLMIIRAKPMISQNFDNATRTDSLAGALLEHSAELGVQCRQPSNSLFNLEELAFGDLINSSTTLIRFIGQRQQLPNVIKGETEFPGMPNETQSLTNGHFIYPLAAFASLRT
jgi:hypothetical protein